LWTGCNPFLEAYESQIITAYNLIALKYFRNCDAEDLLVKQHEPLLFLSLTQSYGRTSEAEFAMSSYKMTV
jgi:hypothetical protein